MAVNEIIKWAINNPNKTIWYVAPNYKQAKNIVWLDPQMLFKYLPKDLIAKRNEVELSVRLVNGTSILLKGVDDPETLRGQNVDFVLFDEYGDIAARWGDMVWEQIIRPILEANHGIAWFLGTPKGQNHFYTLFLKGKKLDNWHSWLLTANDSNIFNKEDLEQLRQSMPEAYFRQEFMCDFVESATSLFKRVDQNIYEGNPNDLETDIFQIGVDLAKYQDWTVITPLNLMTYKVGRIIRTNRVDYTTQKAMIKAESLDKHNARVMLDSTGVGDPVLDDLQNDKVNVEGYKFTETSRKELLANLVILFEQDKIKIPRFDPLIMELKAFQYVLKGNKIREEVPEGMTDDCVMSLALACWNTNRLPRKEVPKELQAIFKEVNYDNNQFKNPFHYD
jgi:hypothetical protein